MSTTTTSMFTHPVVRVAFDPAAQGKMAVSQVDALIKGQVLEKQIDYLDPVLLDLENLSQARD
ncbi:MAG: hypothetical protein HRT89_08770 [Lentisphaeria bacterium]|nr:hypothetical protein [Lentisphaeria bacterium]